MPQFPLRLPTRNELTLIGATLLVFFFASWLRRGEKIAVLEAALAAKPRVEFRDRVVEKRVVVKGPERVVKVLVTAADGTKTATTTTDRAGETITAAKERDLERTETPICPAPYPAKTRHAGVIFGAHGFAGTWVEGVRGGLTLADTWDLTGTVRRDRDGGVTPGGEVSYRW